MGFPTEKAEQFIRNSIKGLEMNFMEENFHYDQETSQYEPEVFLDESDPKRRDDIVKAVKDNLEEAYTFVCRKFYAYSEAFYYD